MKDGLRGWDPMAWWGCVLNNKRGNNQIEALNLLSLDDFKDQPGSYGASLRRKHVVTYNHIFTCNLMRFADTSPLIIHGSLTFKC